MYVVYLKYKGILVDSPMHYVYLYHTITAAGGGGINESKVVFGTVFIRKP